MTAAANAVNRATPKPSPYGRGVYKTASSRYQARASVNGVRVNLGLFDTPEEAERVVHEWCLMNQPGYTGRR